MYRQSHDRVDKPLINLKRIQLVLKRLPFYYPLRYYTCALFFACLFLNYFSLIQNVEEQTLYNLLNFLRVPIFFHHGDLFVGNSVLPIDITLPIYSQLLFLTFFPTIAITSRITFKMRAKILSFGLLYIIVFIILQFLTIVTVLAFDIKPSSVAFKAMSIAVTILSGGAIIEAALFSNITIPLPTKIKSIIKRNYVKEYAYLAGILASSCIMVYFIITFLQIEKDSIINGFILINLYLTLSSIMFFSYFLANFIYEIRQPSNWLKRISLSNRDDKPLSISFLIPAYNEEKIVGRCIESIDRAAERYAGKTEIVLINDGSTDNTEKIVAEAIGKLKYCSGKFYTIPNSGKGFALMYGLEKTSGDIIFRTDADSVMDENLIQPMINHYKDSQVGSVCGWIFPLEDKSLWQKVQNVLCANYFYTKRGQEIVDAIITQPGSSTSFRREAVLKAGGWITNIFGEDGEITNRIARFGYKGKFEQRSIVYTEHPESLIGLMQQRARWGVAFYHSRGRNLRLIGESRCPRSIVFTWNLIAHGLGLGKSLIWPYFVASILTGYINISLSEVPFHLLIKLIAIQLVITVILLIIYAHRLDKVNKVSDIWYFPFIRLINMILNLVVKPQVAEILLSWSSKWKDYNDKSFQALRKEVNRSIDPLYPSGEPIEKKQK